MEKKQRTKEELLKQIDTLEQTNSELAEVNERLLNDLFIGNIHLLSENKIELVEELIESLPNVCFAFNQNGEILSWNKSATNLYGYDKKDVIGNSAIDLLVSPEEQKRTKDIIKGVFDGKSYDRNEWHDYDKNGRRVKHKGKVFPVYRKDGSIAFGLNIDLDLPWKTSLKTTAKENQSKDQQLLEYWQKLIEGVEQKTENLLKKHKRLEKKYKLIAENINDVIWMYNINKKKFDYISPSIYRLTGYSAEETQEHSLGDMFILESTNKIKKHILKNIQNISSTNDVKTKTNIEVQQKCKDGSIIWVEISTSFLIDPESNNICMLGLSRNISENKRTKEALIKSEAKYRQLIEGFTDEYVFYSHSPDGVFDYVSPTSLKIFGYHPTEIIGRHYEEVLEITEESKNIAHFVDEKHIRGEITDTHNIQYIHPNGELKTMRISERPVFDINGNVISVEGIGQDITQWIQAEKALRESEAKFRAVSETSPVAISIFTLNGYIYVNPSWSKLTGYSIEDSKSISPLDVVHPDMRKIATERARARLKGKKIPNRYELKGLKKDGTTTWWDHTAIPIEYEDSTAILALHMDITENKLSEASLRRSEEKFRSLFESSGDTILISKDRAFVDVNEAGLKTFGYKKEELIGKSTNVIHLNEDSYISFGVKVYPEVFLKQISRLEWAFKNKEGDPLYMDLTITEIANGNIMTIMKDRTEQKKIEQTLKESEERFRAVFDSSPMGIYIYELNSNFELILVDSNPAADKHTKIDNTKLYGKKITEAFPKLRETVIPAKYKAVALTGKSWSNTEVKYDDTLIAGTFDIYAFQISQNKMAVMFTDVTDKRKALQQIRESEESYRELAKQLKEANNIKELLLDVITHDLRNPSTVILNSVELFESENPDPELIDIIKSSSRKLFKVMNNAKILTQISSKEDIEFSTIDLNEMIKETIDEFSSLLECYKINVTFRPEQKFMIKANEIISQIFNNYISNVIKYASEGKNLLINITSENNITTIKFSDYGETIRLAEREVIFDRGVQLENKNKTGRGLGLSIVKRIAEAHKGKVWVEPNVPKGNSFCLQIPNNL